MNKFRTVFIAYCCVLGIMVGTVTALFLGVLQVMHNFIWETIPQKLPEPFVYPLIVTTIGGVLVGLFVKHFGVYPKTMGESLAQFKEKKRIDYENGALLKNIGGALLVLAFGASLGPEAALVSIIGGLVTWVGDRMKMAYQVRNEIIEFGIGTMLAVVFSAPLFGVGSSLEKETWKNVSHAHLKRYSFYVIAIVFGFIAYFFVREAFPESKEILAIRNIPVEWTWQGFLAIIPAVFFGALFGRFFSLCEGAALDINRRLTAPLPVAVVAGVILGLFGMVSPYLLFSGESQLFSLSRNAMSMGFFALVLLAIAKVVITMICFGANWRGGTIFPAIFSSVAMGFALATLIPHSIGLIVAVFTASSLAVILGQPLATAGLLMLLFPVQHFLFVVFASFAGPFVIDRLPSNTLIQKRLRKYKIW